MKTTLRPIATKKLPKCDREMAILMGLIDLYVKWGKPIGSQTLQENGFESLSSATIRNYFAKLESADLLKQPHTSGGRIPTEAAFRLYAQSHKEKVTLDSSHEAILEEAFRNKGKEVNTLIQRSVEMLSKLSKCAVFISMPRFDQDFIQDVKLVRIDSSRLLTIIVTDFGLIRTETIYLEQEVDATFVSQCEKYFLWRLNKGEKINFVNELQTKQAQRIYNETMVRHVVGYLNYPSEEILRCGVSRLLTHPEYTDASAMVNSLSLLEDDTQMRAILRECAQNTTLSFWIGSDLASFNASTEENSVIAIPYRINQMISGAIALIGPLRLPYPELFGLLNHFSDLLSISLTDLVCKHKISFRYPTAESCHSDLVRANRAFLLENKNKVKA